jgi:hypothetical protein
MKDQIDAIINEIVGVVENISENEKLWTALTKIMNQAKNSAIEVGATNKEAIAFALRLGEQFQIAKPT